VAKLSGTEVVAVYDKAPLLKILETMREEEKLAEEQLKQKTLPWSMQKLS